MWNDTARGSIPISWGTGAGIFELAPAIASYFVNEATGNDYFYAAISGMAYVHPYREFCSSMPEPGAAWDAYWTRVARYMDRLGTTTTGVYTDAELPFIRAEKDVTTKRILACRHSTRAAPWETLHRKRSTRGSQIFFILTFA